MSNYSLAVQWNQKDGLADNNPDKVVSGDDFNTEFLAVKTAVNSKADLDNTGQTITAATASSGTNTNQVATTAFVQAAVTAATINALVYPVGSIYMNANVATNPATLLGFGTWAAYAEGRVPVGKASSGTFDTLNATGGAETHTLSTSEMPAHNHNWAASEYAGSNDYGTNLLGANNTVASSSGAANNLTTSTVGSSGAHNNLQPYIVVYMWKRTA